MQKFLIENNNYWNKRAQGYCEVNLEELNGSKLSEWIKTIEDNMLEIKNKKIRVLDIGTGPGFFAIIISRMKNTDVVAIDYTDEMLKKAKDNANVYGNNIKFIKMDAHNLEFDNNKFDLIVTRNLTWNLKDPSKAYKEWYRVLDKGGKIINFDANWYNHLFDSKKRQEYEDDRKKVKQSNYKDHYIHTDIDSMESIARDLPLSKIKRPCWDIEKLKDIGFINIKVDENIGDIVWNEEEKINYKSTPMFMIVAQK